VVAPAAAVPAAVPTDPSTTAKPPPSPSAKPKKSRVLLTIPPKVIARAQGLAIFTAVRLGFQAAGSSGSGILLSRLPNGNWSPPSAIQITSIGAGFVAGVDIYDCVIVINTREALDLFTKTRLSLGSDLAVTAGPFGAGGALDWGVPVGDGQGHKRTGSGVAGEKESGLPPPAAAGAPPLSADNTHFQTPPIIPESQQGMGSDDEHNPNPHHLHRPHSRGKDKIDRKPSPFRDAIRKPVYSYVKSRGFYAGVQIDGTVIASRNGANAKFYGAELPVGKILAGEVPGQGPAGMWPAGAKGLFDVLKGAESGKGAEGQPPQQQQQQGTGVGFGGPSPAFGAPVGAGGAPASAWAPPPQGPAQGGVAGVTAGVQNMGVRSVARKPIPGSSTQAPPPPGPEPTMRAPASAKAAEAAADAEAARAQDAAATSSAPPPVYEEMHGQGQEDLPPAYVEGEAYRPAGAGGDSKTGLH
jgi:lipid-binding SYLF domain-containing protein